MTTIVSGVRRARRRIFKCLALISLVGCSPLQLANSKGLDGTDEELLEALAIIGQQGRIMVCDPDSLQKKLGLKLGQIRHQQRVLPNGKLGEEWYLADREKTAKTNLLKDLAYRKWASDQEAARCDITLVFQTHRFCQFNFDKLKKIMRTTPEQGRQPLHHQGQGNSYLFEYKTTPKDFSRIVLTYSTESCVEEINIVTYGEQQ